MQREIAADGTRGDTGAGRLHTNQEKGAQGIMASWGEWLSSATYSAADSLTTAAATVSESSTFQQLKEQTKTIAQKVGEVAETTYAAVEETTESAITSASIIAVISTKGVWPT